MAAILCICYVGRVIYINVHSEGFRIETESYSIGDTIIKDSFSYNMSNFWIVNGKELNDNTAKRGFEETAVYLLSEVRIKYFGNESDKLASISLAVFESGGWHNGCDVRLYNRVNSESLYFNHNEEKTVYIIAVMYPVQFSKSEWKRVYQRKYSMVLDTYPKKVEIKCN